MSDTSQIALIRKLYAAMGDVNSFKSLLTDDVEWDIAEGFPNGGVYRGLEKTVRDFFHSWPTSTSSTRKQTSTSSRAIT